MMQKFDEQLSAMFGLNRDETYYLFSLEYWLVSLELQRGVDQVEKKQQWLETWAAMVFQKRFFGLLQEKPPKSEKELLKRLRQVGDERKRALIFCEALLFTPYFNLENREAAGLSSGAKSEQASEDRKAWEKEICRLAEAASIGADRVLKWREHYLEAARSIAGRSELLSKPTVIALASIALAVTGGFAAPIIGGFIGTSMGLWGAAATSAGLAFLGGGAVAAGGFGVAGGTLAVIGGGAILGAGVGVLASRATYIQDKFILSQLAKIEASLAVVYFDHEDFSSVVGKVSGSHLESCKELQRQNSVDASTTETETKALQKSLEYFKRAIDRLHDLRLKHSGLA